MGPLVPYLISNEFNLMIALLAGIGFGFVLEQAGFSSTKKLAGLFYGYDFTVLKVFFTAGVTAMIGVLLFGHWGILELSLIYINPTFLWSALLGGAIMGLGFIIGGFCPGTSICAAAIGKLDGVAFVFGSALGIVAFAESFPFFEDIYLAENWGPLLINEQLGLSKPVFAVLLTAIALIAFYLTHLIENKVTKHPTEVTPKKRINYVVAGVLGFFLIGIVGFTPSTEEIIENRVSSPQRHAEYPFNEVSSDQLAFEIANNFHQINIIDVRSPEAFEEYHLPLAINIPADEIMDRKWQKIFDQKIKTNYFYADGESLAKKAYLLSNYAGKSANCLLKDSSAEFRLIYSNINPPAATASKELLNTYHYRKKLAEDMDKLVEAMSNLNKPVEIKTAVVKGGC
ncbi:YeeE/YedE thiosulfate transporter family protein [Sunxiuqinia sp. sy24]|uniref:YeeE/YedE thiosulfate transporter family protein n=1 Tax=Sunxiuqinia sp. sy24 TaxID=3461495 RepID=UPI004046720C